MNTCTMVLNIDWNKLFSTEIKIAFSPFYGTICFVLLCKMRIFVSGCEIFREIILTPIERSRIVRFTANLKFQRCLVKYSDFAKKEGENQLFVQVPLLIKSAINKTWACSRSAARKSLCLFALFLFNLMRLFFELL